LKKSHILAEIQRTSAANGGVALGRDRFHKETGIKEGDWYGRHWSRWSDALKEAGLSPNEFQGAYADDVLLGKLADICRELGRFPVVGELKLKHRADPSFPDAKVFDRLGPKHERARRLAEYCRSAEMDDVVAMCATVEGPPEPEESADDEPVIGFVYLFKSGRYFKIGKSNAAGRREREVALQLPEKMQAVHTIRTDDPTGIEAYWHSRFEQKRLNGEWFNLSAADVKAFKRRKFM
jgi:hypothetical protein